MEAGRGAGAGIMAGVMACPVAAAREVSSKAPWSLSVSVLPATLALGAKHRTPWVVFSYMLLCPALLSSRIAPKSHDWIPLIT
jgi:hypothetical protein